MKPIRIFRHEDWIQPGRLAEFLDAKRMPWELVAVDRGEPVLQRLDDVSGLAFLGGTMSVNDDYRWIAEELQLIRAAAARDLPMLGHCFGSQLIAKALGATVASMAVKEIGWHRVRLIENSATREWLGGLPEIQEILIWHHDAFTLPPRAVPLFSSEHCAEQAYAIGKTVATVAHVEVTADMLAEWLRIYGHDIEPLSASVQAPERIRERLAERCAAMHRTFTDPLCEAWISRVAAYADDAPTTDQWLPGNRAGPAAAKVRMY